LIVAIIEKTPMRLAIKFGRSFAGTTPFPNLWSRKPLTAQAISPLVFRGRDDFDQLHITRRIEKMNADEMLF
jgi:hypothetical protein